jgi:hypothetical protein
MYVKTVNAMTPHQIFLSKGNPSVKTLNVKSKLPLTAQRVPQKKNCTARNSLSMAAVSDSRLG